MADDLKSVIDQLRSARPTKLPADQEQQFQREYRALAAKLGIDQNPDDPRHFYDYRSAWKAGEMNVDSTKHFPSKYKLEGHPNLIINGIDTRTMQPSADESRTYSRDLLRSLGYDDATIESVAPAGASAATNDMDPSSLDTLTSRGEAEQLAGQRAAEGIALPEKVKALAAKFIVGHGDDHVGGIASINKHLDDLTTAVGEKAAERLKSGSTNLTMGMAMLDNFTKWSNQLKIDLFAPEEKKALLKLQYLPTEKLADPSLNKEFNTATDMALWALGQKVWGAANELAAIPPAMLGKALGSMHMGDAAAYLGDIAARDRAVAEKQDQIVEGQLPQMVAGMAPTVKYQDILESHFDPQQLDDIYAQMADPGNHGAAMAAAISGLGALADFYGDPAVLLSMIPGAALRNVPAAVRAVSAAKHAEIASEIARGTSRAEDAAAAVKAAEHVTAKAQAALDEAVAAGAPVTEKADRLLRAQRAQAREEHWAGQFQDPGTYEPIMLRPARRNPEYIPELTERQYPLSAGGRSTVRVKSFQELGDEAVAAEVRKKTLAEGADMPVEWKNANIPNGLKEQRLLLGPSDAEYAGDALNMLSRGAEIDDVTMSSGLAPEYYVLPDVQTSLVDMRKIKETNDFELARRIVGKSGEETPSASVLTKRLAAGERLPAGEPGRRPEGLTPAELLKRNEALTRDLLNKAKARGDKEGADLLRGQMRQLKRVRGTLDQVVKSHVYDNRWLPAPQESIMESPKRYNDWLGAAGNRVLRSLYPGGMMLHGWSSKLGQMLSMGREPMRYYMSYDPAAWERVRGGVMRYDRFTKAGYNLMMRELEGAGVLETRSDFNPVKHFSPQKIKDAANEGMFDLLNTRVKSDEHVALYTAASPEMRRAHDRIRAVLDHFADLQGISDTQRYLEGYVRHVFDAGVFKGGARPIEFIGLPANTEMFASHLMERTGGEGYKKDAVLALDMYVRAAYRKLIMEPVYEDIIKTGTELAAKHGNVAHISYANDLVNQLKGKPSFVGAKIDDMVGATWNSGKGVTVPFTDKKLVYQPGDIDRKALGIFSLVHSGLTTGPHYAILQLASGLTTTASRVGPFNTMRGLFQFATKEGQQLAKATGTYRPFVDFLEAPTVRKFTEMAQSKIKSPPLFISNQQAENWSRGITYHAAISMYMRKFGFSTLQEADAAGYLKRIMFEAARTSEEANHLYGPLGRSPWVTRLMGSTGSTAVQQLLSYIPKQSEELLGQVARNPGDILSYLSFSALLMRQAANVGVDMTGDIGLGYLPEGASDITSPAVDAALDNLRMLDALDRGDASEVEKYAKSTVRGLSTLVPGSQIVLSLGKAAQRLQEGAVRTAGGDKLYNMQMGQQPGSGLGGELTPTILLQRNIHETLTRRAIQANRQEDRRFAYNAQKVVDAYVDALESGDEEKAAKLNDELANVYMVRLQSTDPIMRAMEARSVSQTWRSLDGAGAIKDIYWENFKKHGVNIEP
jgi:hypothetical protein